MPVRTRIAGLGILALAVLVGCEAPQSSQQGKLRDVKQASRTSKPDADDIPEAGQPEILPDTHMAAGRLHESQGHLARAVEQYKHAIALNPKQVDAYNRLGIVLDRMGRFKEADEVLAKATQLAPDQAYLHNNLAFSYMMQSRWREAEGELVRALEINPEFARARVNLGMVHAQLDRFDEALVQFQRSLVPEDAFFNLGLMYQSRRRLPEAARAFKTALEKNPKMVAAQKRLDMLPPDVVKAAAPQVQTAVIASPSPTTLPAALIANPAPTTSPAGTLGKAPAATTRPASSARTPASPATVPLLGGGDEPAEVGEPSSDSWQPIDLFLSPLDPMLSLRDTGPADDGPLLHNGREINEDSPEYPRLQLMALWDSLRMPLDHRFGPPSTQVGMMASPMSPAPLSSTQPSQRTDAATRSASPLR